jgi:DNA-binding beta-propeller fold protein YncE
VAYDESRSRGLVADGDLDRLFAVSLGSGNRTTLSASAGRSPTELIEPRAMAVETAENRVLVVDRSSDSLIGIHLANGKRELLADDGNGSGVDLDDPVGVCLAPEAGHALVVNRKDENLVEIDLDSGRIDLVSGSGAGGGPRLQRPLDVILDVSGDYALVGVERPESTWVMAVELPGGDRSEASSTSAGNGPLVVEPKALGVDANGILLVADESDGEGAALIAIEPESGDRIVVSR